MQFDYLMQENQDNGKKQKGWSIANCGSTLFNKNRRSKLQKFKDAMHSITSAHQKNKYGDGEKGELDNRKKKKLLTFPWWTVFVAWACECSDIIS